MLPAKSEEGVATLDTASKTQWLAYGGHHIWFARPISNSSSIAGIDALALEKTTGTAPVYISRNAFSTSFTEANEKREA
jgi:hypothetical protein